jgi:hypothetical protein
MYRLLFQKGPQRGRRVAIRQGPVILGRHPDATLRLPEPEVALQHALLEDQPDGGVRLRRLTACAVVRVNGREIETSELHNGDKIEIGPYQLQFDNGSVSGTYQPTGRRLGLLQLLTLLSVSVLLVGQVIFLFVVSLAPQKVMVTAPPATNMLAVAAPISSPSTVVAVAPHHVAASPLSSPPRSISAPTMMPERVAATPPPPGSAAVSNDLKQIQTEITQLHQELKTLPPPIPAVITNVVVTLAPPPAPMTNAPDLSADDLVLAQARKMFNKVMARSSQLDAEELDGELATIQNLAPDYLPPYIERAQRLQHRGHLPEALLQWQRIQVLAPTNTDLKARAVEEITELQKRLAKPPPGQGLRRQKPEVREQKPSTMVVPVKTGDSKPSAKATAPHAKLMQAVQPVARITQVETQKLLGGEKFDEMRLLHIIVAPVAAAPWDPTALELFVTFLDRGEKSGVVAPSRAIVPGTALCAVPQTPIGAPVEFYASYLIPRGFRQREQQQLGEYWRYFGYRLELVSQGEIQDRLDQSAKRLQPR